MNYLMFRNLLALELANFGFGNWGNLLEIIELQDADLNFKVVF